MTIHTLAPGCTLYHADCRDTLAALPSDSLDSCVTDPPYALVSIVKRFGSPTAAPAKGNDAYTRASAGFMGKTWDTGETAMAPEFWAEVLRVLKPGAFVAAFGASRGFHRMACAIEDAGFEIRDCLLNVINPADPIIGFMESLSAEQLGAFLRCIDDSEFGGLLAWMYGTGFPKSHDLSKGVDDHLFGEWLDSTGHRFAYMNEMRAARAIEDDDARRKATDAVESHWRLLGGFMRDVVSEIRTGWAGTLGGKAALGGLGGAEDIRRETSAATHEAAAWDGWGTALKPAFEPIVLARKPLSEGTVAANVLRWRTGALNIDGCRVDAPEGVATVNHHKTGADSMFSGIQGGTLAEPSFAGRWPANVVTDGSPEVVGYFPDTSPAKAGVRRNSYKNGNSLHDGKPKDVWVGHEDNGGSAARFFYSAKASKADRAGSKHPTVKPISLMRFLARLITPPGGTILEPFAGSGTTGAAALAEGFRIIMCEREAEYVADIRRRIAGRPDYAAQLARHARRVELAAALQARLISC